MAAKKINTIERSMEALMSATSVIERLMEALKIKSHTELAEFLGIGLSRISNWKSRNSVDWDLIIEKTENKININWLITGQGDARFDGEDYNKLKEEVYMLQKKYIVALEEINELRKR